MDVKAQLNAGEYRDMLAAQFKDTSDGSLALNYKAIGLSKIQAYLLGWSFVDPTGKALPITALDSIETDTFTDVLQAIDAHHDANEEAAEARKKARAGSTGSAAT